jgi:hypothetical protein
MRIQKFVWHSTRASQKIGRISLLALLEIPLSTIAFWWLASANNFPITTSIAFLAAPLLLLRSEISIKEGIRYFQTYWSSDRVLSRGANFTIFFCIGLAIGCCAVLIFLARPHATGGSLSAVFGTIGFYFPFALCIGFFCSAYAGSIARRLISMNLADGFIFAVCSRFDKFSQPAIILVVGAVGGSLVGAAMSSGLKTVVAAYADIIYGAAGGVVFSIVAGIALFGTFDTRGVLYEMDRLSEVYGDVSQNEKVARAQAVISAIGMGFATVPLLFVGLFLPSLGARIFATVRNISAGLSRYSKNCFDTFVVADISLPGEILPDSESSLPQFSRSVGALEMRAIMSGGEFEQADKDFAATISICYRLFVAIPTLVYRLNLKANAWIWGSIAFAFSDIVWSDEEEMREKSAYWSTWALLSIVGMLLISSLVWLLSPLLISIGDLPALPTSWTLSISTKYLPPVGTIRYAVLWVSWLALFGLANAAYALRSAHAKALEGGGDYRALPDYSKARMNTMANSVRRWQKINISASVLLAWVVFLWMLRGSGSLSTSRLLWEWIRTSL